MRAMLMEDVVVVMKMYEWDDPASRWLSPHVYRLVNRAVRLAQLQVQAELDAASGDGAQSRLKAAAANPGLQPDPERANDGTSGGCGVDGQLRWARGCIQPNSRWARQVQCVDETRCDCVCDCWSCPSARLPLVDHADVERLCVGPHHDGISHRLECMT
jgi:hypothetical protein